MKKQLSYSDTLFISKKQNKIRELAAKRQELEKEFNIIIEELESLDEDISFHRDCIRRILGRGKNET